MKDGQAYQSFIDGRVPKEHQDKVVDELPQYFIDREAEMFNQPSELELLETKIDELEANNQLLDDVLKSLESKIKVLEER